MFSPQLAVDILSCAVDIVIVIFFAIEVAGAEKQNKIQAKQMELLEELHKLLKTKAQQEIEILEDVHAEISEINDKTQAEQEIPMEEQNDRQTES